MLVWRSVPHQTFMRYQAIATDYDGTLATQGRVERKTLAALSRFVASGRKLLLVTGRQIDDLRRVFPEYSIFELIVAENGAELFDPATEREELLCEPVPRHFFELLRSHDIEVSAGHAIVGAQSADLETVRRALQESGLDLQLTLNKDSLMILPVGITKGTGVIRALADLGLPAECVVAIGDAENDCDLFSACGRAVAVANALPSVKSRAHLVTAGSSGAGVCEVIEQLISADLLACDSPRQHSTSCQAKP
jgi:hydroxymethylpyrimidine pyrophosphatase-like HAD family hydrolase